MPHKFKDNIQLLSKSKELNEITKEWVFLRKEVLLDKTGICICCHKIKYVYYYLNIFNGNIIQIGKNCMNKYINLEIKENNTMKYIRVLRDNNILGKYKNISDLLEYEKDIRENIMSKIIKDINESNTILELDSIFLELTKLLNLMQSNNKFSYFLENKINEIDEKKNSIMEKERIYEEEKQRKHEAEIKRLLREENNRIFKAKEREKKDRNDRKEIKQKAENERLQREKSNKKEEKIIDIKKLDYINNLFDSFEKCKKELEEQKEKLESQ